ERRLLLGGSGWENIAAQFSNLRYLGHIYSADHNAFNSTPLWLTPGTAGAMARTLYCAVDTELYRPRRTQPPRWQLGYMGTYCPGRQPMLERLLLEPARRHRGAPMIVAGAQYPATIDWPANVERIEHIRPAAHAGFYGDQAFTLNLTRSSMIAAGYSPSVRLFEAAACACPIISDWWEGLDSFFKIGEEILVADSPDRIAEYLFDMPAAARQALGAKARARILAEHTAAHRAAELEGYAQQRRAA
ncbi:MAG TPA: glycosyltransferase, partial [Candidatus Binatia bacterium]